MSATIPSKRRYVANCLIGCTALLGVAGFSATAHASSHREAPFITELFKVDATDFFMFRSYETGRAGFVTIMANYIPFQDPNGGPNFYKFDTDALYEIHIDNNGDGREDITFQFRFQETSRDQQLTIGGKPVSIPLDYRGFPITAVNDPNINVRETYTVQIVRGNRRSGSRGDVTNVGNGSATFDKPLDNVGNKTIPNYATYANQHIYNINIPGCVQGRMFVGQRREPFVINVGEIFDLFNIPAAVITGQPTARANDLEMKNMSTLALEVPIACLTQGAEPVIGGYTTASVRQARLINPFTGSPTTTTPTREGGAYAQVSRLANPLVNELFIGRKDKDRFNASRPQNDAQFLDYVTNPTLPALIETAFNGAVRAPTKFPRLDLVATFLTGILSVNQPAGIVPAELMRLNTSTPPVPKGSQNPLGVLGSDNAGFPNGRRPGDDVVDIDLRVAMGALCTFVNSQAFFGCVPGDAPNGATPFTDGAFTSDARFDATFPYFTTPLRGSPQPQNTP